MAGVLATGRHFHLSLKIAVNLGQFHQHFWCQSRAAFEQIIFNAFNGNTIWQKCAKMVVLGAKAAA